MRGQAMVYHVDAVRVDSDFFDNRPFACFGQSYYSLRRAQRPWDHGAEINQIIPGVRLGEIKILKGLHNSNGWYPQSKRQRVVTTEKDVYAGSIYKEVVYTLLVDDT
jgi:hypothetical protein